MRLSLVIAHLLFIVYFFLVGAGWLSVFPIIGLIGSIFSSNYASLEDSFRLENINRFTDSYGIVVAWTMVLLGVRLFNFIYFPDDYTIYLRGVLIHIVLLLGSYVFGYFDGRKIFHVGYLLSWFFFLVWVFSFHSGLLAVHFGMVGTVLTMALYSFITFCVNSFAQRPVSTFMQFSLFVSFCLSVIILIYVWGRDDLSSAVVLSQIFLMSLYCLIYGVYWYTSLDNQAKELTEDQLIENILRGERVLTYSTFSLDEVFSGLRSFLNTLDQRTTYVIGFMNIFLVLAQVYLFVVGFSSGDLFLTQLIFRFGIAAYFVNYLLLREIGFYHSLQRLLAFVLINFGIYLSIITIYGNSAYRMFLIGVSWSIINSLLVFGSQRLGIDTLFDKKDYIQRISVTALASLFNIYFVIILPLSFTFKIALGCTYFGIQIFLSIYNIRYVSQMEKRNIDIFE